jgi:hypothetical protein
MHVVAQIFLFIHLVGFAALFGGLFVQVRANPRVVNNAILHGVLTQLVSGFVLFGLLEAMGTQPDHVKYGVKLVVAAVIAVLAVMNRRRPLSSPTFLAMALLTLLNVGVAVFWH